MTKERSLDSSALHIRGGLPCDNTPLCRGGVYVDVKDLCHLCHGCLGTVLSNPLWVSLSEQGLGQVDPSRGPFPPQPLRDTVILHPQGCQHSNSCQKMLTWMGLVCDKIHILHELLVFSETEWGYSGPICPDTQSLSGAGL